LCSATAQADGPSSFEDPFRVTAGDKFIDVEVGHAAPWHIDWDGDGVKDLLVGQFGEGKLRIYRNVGTDAQPKFNEDYALFQTRAGLGSIPSG
jgi:hypothetical protein